MGDEPASQRRYETPTNYTAQRALRAVEVVAFTPASARMLAGELGIHERTARRIMRALAAEGYVERNAARPGAGHWHATHRLLALAVQLHPRLPVVAHGERVVRELHERSGLGAALYSTSYRDVFVLASAGEAPAVWTRSPAFTSPAGRVLLAHRDAWRAAQLAVDDDPGRERLDADATAVRDAGYVSAPDGLAVVVPDAMRTPMFALALHGPLERGSAWSTLTSAANGLGDLLVA